MVEGWAEAVKAAATEAAMEAEARAAVAKAVEARAVVAMEVAGLVVATEETTEEGREVGMAAVAKVVVVMVEVDWALVGAAVAA